MAKQLLELLDALNQENDDLLTEIEKLRTLLDVDTARGVWLDVVGSWVGNEPRQYNDNTGKPLIDDIEYRKRVKVQIDLNKGNGTIEDVILAIRKFAMLTSGLYWDDVKDLQFALVELGASIYVDIVGGNISTAYQVKQYVAAGVGLFIGSTSDTPFAFSSVQPGYDPEDGSVGYEVRGFSNLISPTVGGNLKYFLTTKG